MDIETTDTTETKPPPFTFTENHAARMQAIASDELVQLVVLTTLREHHGDVYYRAVERRVQLHQALDEILSAHRCLRAHPENLRLRLAAALLVMDGYRPLPGRCIEPSSSHRDEQDYWNAAKSVELSRPE